MENAQIYFAAPLFNSREKLYNLHLTNFLESNSHKVFLPQRDGMEFSSITNKLFKHFPNNDVSVIRTQLIYILDVGYFIPKSDLVLANLDEPVDEGVVVEICNAKSMKKSIIGWRSDVRAPFGDYVNAFSGLHPFPAFECTKMLIFRNYAERHVSDIGKSLLYSINSLQKPVAFESEISALGKRLFEDINIHSDSGLEELILRYKKNNVNSLFCEFS